MFRFFCRVCVLCFYILRFLIEAGLLLFFAASLVFFVLLSLPLLIVVYFTTFLLLKMGVVEIIPVRCDESQLSRWLKTLFGRRNECSCEDCHFFRWQRKIKKLGEGISADNLQKLKAFIDQHPNGEKIKHEREITFGK